VIAGGSLLAGAPMESPGGWTIPLAVLLLFTLGRFLRVWRRSHPSKHSWQAREK
jgi:hypothetical protein